MLKISRSDTTAQVLPVKRPFGHGAAVSLFTLGTMRAIDSPAQMEAVLAQALAIGINHLETAAAYGPAEAFLGMALNRLRDAVPETIQNLIITTKLLPGPDIHNLRQQFAGCLRRLNQPRIANLAIHGLNTTEHLNWMLHGPGAELRRWALGEGLVQQLGFSSHGPSDLIRAALDSGHFGFCSLHLHLFDQERLPLARAALEQGMGVMAISPADKGGHLYAPPAELLGDCAPFHPLELAYRFLLDQGISTLTLGAVKPADLAWARQLAGRGEPLNAAESEAIRRINKAGSRRLGSNQCHECRNCLPCPQDVPIPTLLWLRNLSVGYGMESFTKERYNLIGRAGHWWELIDASACNNCGVCLPRCPHQLTIPSLLADTHQRLVEAPRRRLWD